MNTLPDLPKKKNKREAKITPTVLKWFQKNYPFSVAIEVKVTRGKTISKSALEPHQLKALLASQSSRGLSFKIPDASKIRLPFDAFQLKKAHAFVVVCFLKYGVAMAIDPRKWEGANIDTQCAFKFDL